MLFDLQHRIKPVLKWAGGKSSSIESLIVSFPSSFDRYIEPFLGGGAVFLTLKPGVPALLGDGNKELIELYEVISEEPVALMEMLDSLAFQYSEAFYYETRQLEPSDRILKAARTIFLNKTGFNGLYRQNSKGKFNVPFGKRTKCPALYDRENFLKVSKRLKSAQLFCSDFAELIDQAGPGDFVYCDPPYEPLSKTSNFTGYVGGGFSSDEQLRLRDSCQRASERGAKVAISNSTAPFILEAFQDWKVERLLVKRAINCKGTGRGAIDELLATL